MSVLPPKPRAIDPRHVEWVADALADCKPVREIEKQLLAVGWARTRAEALEIVRQGYDALHELGLVVVNRRDQYRDALMTVYQAALAADKFQAAIRALDKLIELDGVAAPVQAEVAITSPGGAAAIRERLAKLLDDPDVAGRVLEKFGLPAAGAED